MLPKLYGNKIFQKCLYSVLNSNRSAQSFLLYGEESVGKKTFAKWLAAAILCEENNAPCDNCKSCRTVASNVHPDCIWVQHSGKSNGFSVETIRNICSSVSIAPNNGKNKVYIFADCDNMDSRSQNMLLKILEEPPEYAYFIFTASTKEALLSTIRSRILSFAVSECTENECYSLLKERGYIESDIQYAIEHFHGNAGKCIALLEDSQLKESIKSVSDILEGLMQRNEYKMLSTFNQVGKDRAKAKNILLLIDKTIRDALVMRYSPEQAHIGCTPEITSKLSERLSSQNAQAIHIYIESALEALDANVNVSLTLSAFCAECMITS